MKLLILSDANSIHTQKWVTYLSKSDFEIQLFSLFKPKLDLSKIYERYNVKVISPDLELRTKSLREPNLSKIRYLQSIPLLRKTIARFNPDILHAHYASSYGLLGVLTRFKPLFISVWGSDIYYFPYKNKFNKWLLKKILNNCDRIFSTSNAMKQIIEKEYNRFDVKVISFGIDLKLFKPKKNKSKFIVGTIKSLESHNGIDCLIDAAELVVKRYNNKIDFQIIGKGLLKDEMEQRVKNLNIEKNVKFLGFVPHKSVVEYYNYFSIFVAVSTRESFGVSVLEAAACEIPSITSNVGGLKEVNKNNETGIIVEPNDPISLADSIINLYEQNSLRLKLGENARKRVIKKFNWQENLNQMIKAYKSYK